MVKQENIRLNSRGNPSTPPAWQPKLGWFLFAQKSMLMNRHRDNWAGQAGGSPADTARARQPSLVLDQSLHLVHEVPGQLQDLLGVVPLGHL